MGGKLPKLYTHRPPRSMCVSEVKTSAPFGPLRTPGDRAPRGLISACVFAPQGTLDPALYPRPAFTRAQSLKPFRPQRSVFQQKNSKAPIFERPQHSLLQTPISPGFRISPETSPAPPGPQGPGPQAPHAFTTAQSQGPFWHRKIISAAAPMGASEERLWPTRARGVGDMRCNSIFARAQWPRL